MSKIIRVAHSFCRKSDNQNEMADALCERLRLTTAIATATKAILATKNGYACRNVDIIRDHNITVGTIICAKNILEYVGAIRRTEEFMVVNWSNIRKIIATPMTEPLATRGEIEKWCAKHNPSIISTINGKDPYRCRSDFRPGYVPKPKKATTAPSLSAESIQAMIKAEVHSQMIAMAQRMTSI